MYIDIIKSYLAEKGENMSEKEVASVARTLSDESFEVTELVVDLGICDYLIGVVVCPS